MPFHRGRLSRLLLSAVFALALLAPAMPALADGDEEHEAEVANLEVKAAPAVVKAGHPVLIKARFRVDEDCLAQEEQEAPADESTEDPVDDSGDSGDNADDGADLQSEHDVEGDDADTGDEADEAADCEDESDEDADDTSGDDTSGDDTSGDDELQTFQEDDTEAGDDARGIDSEGCTADDDTSGDDTSGDDTTGDDTTGDDTTGDDTSGDEQVQTLAQGNGQGKGRGHGQGRGGDACAPVSFTFDFGDGSEPVTVGARGKKAEKAKAYVHHVYDTEGDYEVTVVATPDGGEAVTAVVTVQVGKGKARLSGRDRFETGTDLSEEAFPDDGSADAVVLARADGFADALASATLATLSDAPVLLTNTDGLPDSVLAEIQRVLVPGGTVYVLGGTAAISDDVVTTLTGLGYVVERIAGTDRVDTSLQVAEEVLQSEGEVDEVVVAAAGNFPDALSGAAHAAKRGAPILLTPGDALDPRVRDFLAGLPEGTTVLLAGGRGVVSDDVLAEIAALGLDVRRVGGKDRFATSAQIAEEEFAEATTVVIATGKAFPDALSGAGHAGRLAAPVLLVGDTLPDDVRAYLEAGAGRIDTVYVIGGANAVPAGVMAEIAAILGL